MAALGYPGAKISLKEDDVPPRIEASCQRAVSWIQVMSAHGEFCLGNSDSILWRV